MPQRMQAMHPTPQSKAEVNPAMVVLARESRGLSQKGLADLLTVDQTAISKIESGLRSPSTGMLERLSRALGYPVGFFYQVDRVYGLGMGDMFHRKRQDVPAKTLLKLHANINIWRMQLDRLLRAVELPECRITSVDIEDYDFIVEDVARFMRASWKLPMGPVANLCTSIEDAGGIVIPFDFETPRVDAVSHWVPPLPPLFFINTQIPTDRMRFSLAHELGHMVMHQASHTYYQLSDAKEAEDQADAFAAEFLMPEREIGPQFNEVNLRKLALLKPYWRVSMAALLRQAERLGKVTSRHARSLWAQMAQNGWKRREPADLDLPQERPALLQELVDLYRRELAYTADEVSSLINAHEDHVRAWYYQQGHLRMVP